MEDIINESDFILYRGEDGNTHAQVILGDQTVWMSQKAMGDTFGVGVNTINYHLGEIFKADEFDENSVIRKIRITAADKKTYLTQFYGLDIILLIGYRVNSYKAMKFRQWSNRILSEYLVKGFVLDDERLKQGNKLFGKDYFQELLERIQAIRASEKMFYEKIRDLYATSVDYDPQDPTTQKFFAKVQNKVEYAIVGRTSAETIMAKANALMPNMNLRTWKNIKRDGKIQKSDITIAKNYFTEDEIKQLNSLINMYLDFAKLQVERNRLMKMSDWENRLDAFLNFNEFQILKDFGSVKKEVADRFAEQQYHKYKYLTAADSDSEFKNISEAIYTNGKILDKKPEIQKEPLSEFNNKLKTALNFNTGKDNKPKTSKKLKGKECPNCGFMNDKDADYCTSDILDENGDIKPCGHSFGALTGKDGWGF